MRSQRRARLHPAPAATPVTIAIVGLGHPTIRRTMESIVLIRA
jgi:hypothetical protein